ncbi:hypothetical protein Tco_0724141, partial [Tanacetum coccineum]
DGSTGVLRIQECKVQKVKASDASSGDNDCSRIVSDNGNVQETSRTLGESNSIRDSCLVALQNKQNEFERYKAFNDRTVNYDKLELGKINAECYRGRHRQERDDVQHFEDWIRENIMPPRKAPRTRTTPATTTNTTSVTNAQLQAMIDQGVNIEKKGTSVNYGL